MRSCAKCGAEVGLPDVIWWADVKGPLSIVDSSAGDMCDPCHKNRFPDAHGCPRPPYTVLSTNPLVTTGEHNRVYHHKMGGQFCAQGECKYMEGRMYHRRCLREPCQGTRHAIEADWGDFSFGHKGGPVHFRTICDACGDVWQDPSFVSCYSQAVESP